MRRRVANSLRWHIGDVVAKLRLDKDWTASELADRAGVSKNTITDIEKGRTRGSSRLSNVATALGTTVEEMRALIPEPTEYVEAPGAGALTESDRATIRAASESLTKAMERLEEALRRVGG
jgi:transcriptional regulator with XRE-family HTH domain